MILNKLSNDYNTTKTPVIEQNPAHFYQSFDHKPKSTVASMYVLDQVKRKKNIDDALTSATSLTHKHMISNVKDQIAQRPLAV